MILNPPLSPFSKGGKYWEEANMQKERIRILVDRSRDSAWSDALLNIEPDDIYLTTDNKDHFKWSVLKNYDVLTMCGYPVLQYKDEEIQAIKQFVELGGGLLLASSSSRFERDVGKDISEMTLNKIARIFGAEFLPLESCKADTITDEHFIRGYHKDDIFIANRAEFAELYEYDIPLSNCGIISVPESANFLINHEETLEPISASINFGKGKIIIINDTTFLRESHRMCRGFLDWLGRNRFSKISGDEHIPDEIPVDEFVKKDMDIEIHYNKFVTDERVNTCLDFAKRIYEYVNGIFPDSQNRKWKIELSPSCTNETISWRNPAKGAYVSDPMLAYALGDAILGRISFLNMLARNVFYADIFHKYFGITGMRLLGFENEADEFYMQIAKQLKELDPTGTKIDITKIYHYYHPKLVWILTTLTDKYGYDIFARIQKNIPRDGEIWNEKAYYKPREVFSPLDIFIYYLSLTVGEDMYSWFRKIGTTVHPFPLYKEDTDEFRNGVLQYLRNVMSDKSASASDRDNALKGLINVCETEKLEYSEKILSAIKLAQSCDGKALETLKELADNKDDIGLSAIASLELAKLRDHSVIERLIETAKYQDDKFQLNVKNALQKLEYNDSSGFNVEKEVLNPPLSPFSKGGDCRRTFFKGGDCRRPFFKGGDCRRTFFKGGNGSPSHSTLKSQYDFSLKNDLIGMDIEYDTAELKIYATINGQRVAHVFSYVDYGGHFLGNTHVSLAFVSWVSTEPEFRRLGLSSLIMRETFAHPSFQRCSCSALCTGTENPAHTMYRDFGFIDMSYLETFSIDLHEEKVEIPEDIVIRSYLPGDEIKMTQLANEYYSSVIGSGRKRAVRMKLESKIIKIVERNGDILGFVEASIASTDKKAEIGGICLKKGDELEKIGLILLKSLHNDLVSQGFNRLEFWNEHQNKELLRPLLNKLGYCCRSVGGVNMFKIINLPMFLEEITSLLTKQLKNSNYKDWQGKIGIIGDQHKATVIIENGEIGLAEEILSDANITLSADDATITGVVIGKLSPYEAYLQQEMKIKPIVNNDITGLLKTLFPKIPN